MNPRSRPIGPQLRQILRTPAIVIPGVLDAISEWSGTRNWLRIIPAFLVLGLGAAPFCFSTLRLVQRKDTLTTNFLELSDRTVPFSDLYEMELQKVLIEVVDVKKWNIPTIDESVRSKLTNQKSMDSIVALRICVKHAENLTPSNTSIQFRLGMIEDLVGNLESADELLAKLAPSNKVVSPKAHAIQAIRLLQLAKPDDHIVSHHFQALRNWDELDPRIALAGSFYFEEQDQLDLALEFGKYAAKKLPNQEFRIGKLAEKLGDAEEVLRASEELVNEQSKLQQAESDSQSVYELAWAMSKTGRGKEGIQILQEHLRQNKNPSESMKRLLSDMIIDSYTTRSSKTGLTIVSEQLDAAAEADPANARVGEFTARKLLEGAEVPVHAKNALKLQLDNQTASAETLAIVAKVYFSKGKIEEARTRAELALQKSPTHFLAIDVVAKIGMLGKGDNADHAMEVINKALELGGTAAPLLDLRGDIASFQGKKEIAIEAWEEVIAINANSTEVRGKLVRAYQALGNLSEAKKHEQALIDLGGPKLPSIGSVATPP